MRFLSDNSPRSRRSLSFRFRDAAPAALAALLLTGLLASDALAWKVPGMDRLNQAVGKAVKPIADANNAIHDVTNGIHEVGSIRDSLNALHSNVDGLIPADGGKSDVRASDVFDQSGHGLNLVQGLGAWTMVHFAALTPIDTSARTRYGDNEYIRSMSRGRVETSDSFRARAAAESDALFDRIGAEIARSGRFVLTNVQLGPVAYSPDQQILLMHSRTGETTEMVECQGPTGASDLPRGRLVQNRGSVDLYIPAAPALAEQVLDAQDRMTAGQSQMTADVLVAIELSDTKERRHQIAGEIAGLPTVELEVPIRLRIEEIRVRRSGAEFAHVTASCR